MPEDWFHYAGKEMQGKGIICTNIIAGIKMMDLMDRLMREFWIGFSFLSISISISKGWDLLSLSISEFFFQRPELRVLS